MVLLSRWLIWWASDTMPFSGCGCSIYCQNWAKNYPITSTSKPTESRVAGTRSINTTSGSLWVMVSRAQGHSYFLPSVGFQNHVLYLLRTQVQIIIVNFWCILQLGRCYCTVPPPKWKLNCTFKRCNWASSPVELAVSVSVVWNTTSGSHAHVPLLQLLCYEMDSWVQ